MKINILILISFLSMGCYGQIENIYGIIKHSTLVDLPIDYEKLAGIKGDDLQEKFKKELSLSQYFLIIKDKKLPNNPLSFQNLSLVGRVNFSSKYCIAIFREDVN